MKQKLFLIAILMVVMIHGYAQEGFKISGKVANIPDGTVWLMGRRINWIRWEMPN